MLKKLSPITLPSPRKEVLTLKASHVNSTKLVIAHRKVTMQLIDSCISISVAAATVLTQGLDTRLRTVEMLNVSRRQKMSEVLQ